MTTSSAIVEVLRERERQIENGFEGILTAHNDLIALAIAYLGRASSGALINENRDPREMLVKAAAVLIDAIERTDPDDPDDPYDSLPFWP